MVFHLGYTAPVTSSVHTTPALAVPGVSSVPVVVLAASLPGLAVPGVSTVILSACVSLLVTRGSGPAVMLPLVVLEEENQTTDCSSCPAGRILAIPTEFPLTEGLYNCLLLVLDSQSR